MIFTIGNLITLGIVACFLVLYRLTDKNYRSLEKIKRYAEKCKDEIAAFAEEVNQQTENIGARRLYTILEKILADLSFEAPERSGETVVIDMDYVHEHIQDVRAKKDLSRYIL